MEPNISSRLDNFYFGNLVFTSSRNILKTSIELIRLNNLLVKISFSFNQENYIFRAMLSEQEEGLLMIIQDRVTQEYKLSGVSGFLYQKPNVHGGLIHKMNSFYFHVRVNHFSGGVEEVYFIGKNVDQRAKSSDRRVANRPSDKSSLMFSQN